LTGAKPIALRRIDNADYHSCHQAGQIERKERPPGAKQRVNAKKQRLTAVSYELIAVSL
jgi:hypothetical protein